MSRFSRYGTVSRSNPEAAGMCDYGGELRKHSDLHKQMMWVGSGLKWNGMMVCKHHMDVPQPQDRKYVLRADPVPVPNARPDLDVAHIKRTLVYADGAALTYPTGEWIESALGEDVDRGLSGGGIDTTPPIIPPILDLDLYAPLDVFVLGYNVLAPGGTGNGGGSGTITPPATTDGLFGADGATLLGADGAVLFPPI